MASEIRTDLLFKALKDAQQEKLRLENKLKESRSQRAALEKRLEAVAAKHNQVKDVKTKMSETLRVAVYKVEETQKQGNNIEMSNMQKRKRLDELTTAISSEKERQLKETMNFEKNLSDLTKQFLDAKDLYKDDNMLSEIAQLIKKTEYLHQQMPKLEKEMQELNEQLENINLGKEPELEIPQEEQKQILAMFKEENQKAEEAMKKSVQNLAELETQLRQIDEE